MIMKKKIRKTVYIDESNLDSINQICYFYGYKRNMISEIVNRALKFYFDNRSKK